MRDEEIRFLDGDDGEVFDGIGGHGFEKYAVAAACAGRHNIMVCGAFWAGPRIRLLLGMKALLPALSGSEMDEIRRIYSKAKESLPAPEGARPFRVPLARATIGEMLGGPELKPGESTLAHGGVLLLDLPQEFRSSVLQMLRIPADNRKIMLTRGGHSTALPADFQLAVSCLPCACGNFGSEDAVCQCTLPMLSMHWKKLQPVLDRIEIRVGVGKDKDFPDVSIGELRKKVRRAWTAQLARQDRLNSRLPEEALDGACSRLETTREQAEALHRMDRRGVRSVASLAMTVADMEGHPEPREEDVEMALRLHSGLDAVLRTAGIQEAGNEARV